MVKFALPRSFGCGCGSPVSPQASPQNFAKLFNTQQKKDKARSEDAKASATVTEAAFALVCGRNANASTHCVAQGFQSV